MSSPIATDLRHMTSSHGLSTPVRESNRAQRVSQHLRTTDARLGSRSPSSIPSSPTSVHSSSSAIFERDIEPIASASPTHAHPQLHPPNPHRIPRAKATEQLEQSVPSVLDSAAAILAGLDDADAGDQVAVVAPASSLYDLTGRSSGFASPIGSFRSRSPSPLGTRAVPTSLLLSIPHPGSSPPGSGSRIPSQPTSRPSIQTSPALLDTSSTPSIATPTSAYFTSAESSPTTTTREHPLPAPSAASPTSHPPSPHAPPTKRLSFMSYADLLTSTPSSTLPLSSLTTSASTIEPPPHIPSVSGLTQQHQQHLHAASAAASIRAFVIGGGASLGLGSLDDVGGEWEREGLGRGLEERLEALMPVSPAVIRA